MPELRIDGGQVEVHLPCVLGLELTRLELDHHEAAELEMEEQEVDVEVLAVDLKVHLAADEGESNAQLEQEDTNMLEQPTLEVSFLRVRPEREEVEHVRVLQRLLGEL